MKFKILAVILFLSLTLYSRERMPIATIDLDHSLRANEPLRKELVKAINIFVYLKQKASISVDRQKKKLFGTNELNLEQGLTVASNLNVRIAIIMKSEKVLKNTNNNQNKIDNLTIKSNEINDIMSNYNMTNTILSNDIIKDEELYDIKYNFQVIDIETGETLKEYDKRTSSEALLAMQEICLYLEFYFSNLLFKKIEHQINGINLTLRAERTTLENKTNARYDRGEIIEGESFTLNFRCNMDGYVYIFAFQNDGNVILMHPNDFNNFIDNKYQNETEGKKNYIIPPENSIFRIRIRPPFGEDAFYAVYSKKELPWITGLYFKGDGFKICDKSKVAEFTAKLKSTLKFMNNNNWQISKIYLQTISELEED